jgi:phage tail-like protein
LSHLTEACGPAERLSYRVTWAGQVLRGVRRVSGLTRLTEVVEHREGGAGPLDPPLKLPGRTDFRPVILELGPPRNRRFETWAQAAAGLAPPSPRLATRQDIWVELLDESGGIVLSARIFRCWVSEYSLLPYPAPGGDRFVIQRFRLEHEGFVREV